MSDHGVDAALYLVVESTGPAGARLAGESRMKTADRGAQLELITRTLLQADRAAGAAGEETAFDRVAAHHACGVRFQPGLTETKQRRSAPEHAQCNPGGILSPPDDADRATLYLRPIASAEIERTFDRERHHRPVELHSRSGSD